jgi:uncharacterized protein (TIGR01244 family)
MTPFRSATACAAVCLTATVAAAQPAKQDIPGITNFTRIDAPFACAGATEVKALAEIKKQGFKSVVNFRLATEEGANVEASKAEAERIGLKYFHLPFTSRSPDPAVPDRFLKIVADPENQPVFIHCTLAIRAGGMWFVKRVLADGWSIEDALKEAEFIGLTEGPAKQFLLGYVKDKKGGR